MPLWFLLPTLDHGRRDVWYFLLVYATLLSQIGQFYDQQWTTDSMVALVFTDYIQAVSQQVDRPELVVL